MSTGPHLGETDPVFDTTLPSFGLFSFNFFSSLAPEVDTYFFACAGMQIIAHQIECIFLPVSCT